MQGVANVSGSMQGIRGTTTKVTVHLYLQQYSDGEWIDYDDWLESVEGISCTVNKNVAVPSGYKYRAKASCYAYAGNKCEQKKTIYCKNKRKKIVKKFKRNIKG